jgi:rhodanese-related sulfurtransferase
MDMKVASTIGYERAHNDLLAEADEDRFVERAIAGLGAQPPNLQAIVARNRGPLRAEAPPSVRLTPHELAAAAEDGALVVDVRTDAQFDEAHVPGAVCVPAVRAGFGTKLAWLADPDEPVAFVADDDAGALHAARLAAAVAIDRIAGHLGGGMASWHADGRPVERVERLTVPELHTCWEAGDLQVLDAREPGEWEDGVIPGSVLVPYHDLHALPDGLDPARPVAAICASGQRSAVAASLLQRLGAYEVLHVVEGGVGTWKRAGWPTDRP